MEGATAGQTTEAENPEEETTGQTTEAAVPDEGAVVLEEGVILTESETETETGLPQNDSSGDDSSVDLIDTEETFFETAEEETELSTAADADSVTMITDISTEAASEDAEMLIEEISEDESISGENAFADPQNTDLAEGEVLTGSFGDDLTYTLDSSTGVLSFTGNGEIPRLYTTADANGVTLSDYIEVITSVVVGDGITSIGDHAFHGFENIAGLEVIRVVRYSKD